VVARPFFFPSSSQRFWQREQTRCCNTLRVPLECRCNSHFDGNVSFAVNNENQKRFANHEKQRQAAGHNGCLCSHLRQAPAAFFPGTTPCVLSRASSTLRTVGLSYALFITVPHPHLGLSASINCDDSVMTNSAEHIGLIQCHFWPMCIILPLPFSRFSPVQPSFLAPRQPPGRLDIQVLGAAIASISNKRGFCVMQKYGKSLDLARIDIRGSLVAGNVQ